MALSSTDSYMTSPLGLNKSTPTMPITVDVAGQSNNYSTTVTPSTGNHVYTVQEFDVIGLTFGKPRSLDNGQRRMIQMLYKQVSLPRIQFPRLRVPFPINMERDRRILSLSFANDYREPGTPSNIMFETMTAIEKRVIAEGAACTMHWFKKALDVAVIEASMVPIVKFSRDKRTGEVNEQYPPTVQVTLPTDNKTGKVNIPVFDENNKPLDIGDASSGLKGHEVDIIAVASTVWVGGGRFGVTWRAQSMRILPPKINAGGGGMNARDAAFAFEDDE